MLPYPFDDTKLNCTRGSLDFESYNVYQKYPVAHIQCTRNIAYSFLSIS